MDELFKQGVTMTYSGVFTRGGKKVVHVCFERKNPSAFAEGVLPDCNFLKCDGFSDEEKEVLKVYLQGNSEQIFEMARTINNQVLFKL